MAAFEKEICDRDRFAYWYRLGIIIEGQEWVYPAIEKPTLRFDGERRQTPGFRMAPYEPPVIPKAGVYSAIFYDCAGDYIEIPLAGTQFNIQPILAIALESGERGKNYRKNS